MSPVDRAAADPWKLRRARDSLPTEFGLHHNKFQFSAADLQGDCMKKKLDSLRPSDRSPPLSLLTSSISSLANRVQPEKRFTQSLNAPFQLPIHSRVPFEAQQRDFSPTFSSHSTPFHQTPARSPLDFSDHDHSPRGSSRRNNSDDASMYGSFAEDTEMDETSSLKRLHIEDANATIGQKRRAASPAADDLAHHAMLQGYFMCECCPKKPKKFETREELGAHEAEKQYECSFCGNRFKNKNEAERHQNSLHVRRHSWSCSALAGYYRAFHESTVRPGQADACGYCGEEFSRSGVAPRSAAMSGGMSLRHATDQDWDERIRHLQEIHKFRECNSSKKFYRADHFRQHLKHSHAGTSGKWTNMLENACLIEEDPTPR
ncbi:Zinc finger protein 549 [Escovopsis weberi]|uniref:Zinc finger protein 549 n=1 Tax=Escovopsis weberi TaxID=150374 RepID=A0A0M8MWT5_ESCWE|nr:Zinc finger protein 549 [Escovopsis weberi]